ncbi:MAG: HAD family hydrolase [Planctomycetota bacterium]
MTLDPAATEAASRDPTPRPILPETRPFLPAPRDSEVARRLCCVISDVDGVMTDGRIIHDSAGVETKAFHVHDGLAIRRWIKAGFGFCVITARGGPAVENRMRELGVSDVYSFCSDKLTTAQQWLAKNGYDFDQAIYLGDDIADLRAMLRCGLAIAPADATTDVRRLAHRISRAAGGRGVLREVIEWAMQSKGCWELPPGIPNDPPPGPEL